MNRQTDSIKALLLDLSGVLYDGDQAIEGAAEMVQKARDKKLVLRFVTNTATKSRRQILDKLAGMGIELEEDELFTAPDAARAYLREKSLTPFCLIHANIRPDFHEFCHGDPNAVVLGDAREDLNYANLNRAFRLAQKGSPLIAIGENKYFAEGDTLCLDAGPFIHAVAWAADAEPIVMGKPGKEFFQQVVNSTGCKAEECLMIGDDVIGDVEGALCAGLQARLVKTGKYQDGDEGRIEPQAETLDSIADLGSLL